MNLFEEYEKATEMKKRVDAAIDELKEMILDKYKDEVKDSGSSTINEGPYKMIITNKMTTSVDQKLAEVIGIGFTKKYALSKTLYNKLSSEDKKRVDECISEKPAKTAFKFERVEE